MICDVVVVVLGNDYVVVVVCCYVWILVVVFVIGCDDGFGLCVFSGIEEGVD